MRDARRGLRHGVGGSPDGGLLARLEQAINPALERRQTLLGGRTGTFTGYQVRNTVRRSTEHGVRSREKLDLRLSGRGRVPAAPAAPLWETGTRCVAAHRLAATALGPLFCAALGPLLKARPCLPANINAHESPALRFGLF